MSAFLQKGLFYLVLLALLLSFQKKPGAPKEKLGKDTFHELKGLAILMVLFGHMTLLHQFTEIPATPVLGAPAVEIFLFLSGFGLVVSYSGRGLKGFIPRRLLVVLIPFWIVNLIKIPFYLTFGVPAVDILLSFTLFDIRNTDTSMWYLQYLLLCYLIFWMVFSIRKFSLQTKAALVFSIFAIAAVVNGIVYYLGASPASPFMECYSHHLSFGLGVLFFLFYKQYQRLSGNAHMLICCIAFIFMVLNQYGFAQYETYYLLNTSYLIFCLCLFGWLSSKGAHSKLLQKLGDLSYHIYLNEYCVMIAVHFLLDIPDGWKALLTLVLSIALAIPTKLAENWMIRRLPARLTGR